MAQAVLQHIPHEIQTLEAEELHELERTVKLSLEPLTKAQEREAVLRVLEKSGLVQNIKRPPLNVERERPLVSIKGKPLSETIIEERR